MGLVGMWTTIGGTMALGYWMLGQAIKLNEQEIKENNRKKAEDLAKP